MKKLYLLIIILFPFLCLGQGGKWTWVAGDSTGASPVYGVQGVPSPLTKPPGVYEPAQWTDLQGNAWIYGGLSTPANNDMWKFDMQLQQWAWMGGSAGASLPPFYGVKGVPGPNNRPSSFALYSVASWTDLNGNFWMIEYETAALWKYDPVIGQWAWMNGDTTMNPAPVYGVQGIPSPLNFPGSRAEQGNCWTSATGDLWLFGGWHLGDMLSDTWKYDIITNEWTWMKGPTLAGQPGIYGIKGVDDPANNPGARGVHCKWKDSSGNLWMFGGSIITEYYNDVWKYNTGTNTYTWMSGTNLISPGGTYGPYCVSDSLYAPASRWENRSCWFDACDNFWIYGGAGPGILNDLWHFSPVTNKWTLIDGGKNFTNLNTVYGTLGVADTANDPAARFGAVTWMTPGGDLYMFGGGSSNGSANDVWKYSFDTACPAFSSCIQLPSAMLQSSDTVFCSKQTIDFFDLSSNNPQTWMWYFPGAIPDTSTAQNPTGIYYANYGSFDVALKVCNTQGCDSMFLPGFINVLQLPPAPVITFSGDTLFSSAANSYQWYEVINPSLVLSTDSFYPTSQPGSYYVVTCDSSGCCIASNIFTITGVGEFRSTGPSCRIVPNPNNGRFKIIFENVRPGLTDICVYNSLGESIYNSASKINSGSYTEEIDLSEHGGGIYLVSVVAGDFRQNIELILIR